MEQLFPFMLKSVLPAGAALGLLWQLRHRSAAARGVVAHLALLALVLMPVANLLLPPLPVAVPGLADLVAVAPALPGPPEASPAAGLPPPSTAASTAATPEAVSAIATSSPLLADDMAILAYALPAILLLFITFLATGRLFVLRARAGVLEDAVWLDALARAQRRMRSGGRTLLLVSDDLNSPISWGRMRPVILLDRKTLGLHDQAEAIVAHELAHIARFDWVRLLFGRVATALYWFNPLVWMLAREAHQLREEAADDAVLAEHVVDIDYAQLLLRTARHQDKVPLLTAHGVAPSRHSLARRIRRVLNAHAARGPATPGFIASVAAGIITLAAPLAALSTDARGAPSENAGQPKFAAIVMKTVSLAAERSAELVHNAIESPLQASRPTQTAAPAVLQMADQAAAPAPAAAPQSSVTASNIVGAEHWGAQRLKNEAPTDGVPTIAELQQLPDWAAADRMLGTLKHGPISSSISYGGGGMVAMVEDWTVVPEGCQRLRWTVTFQRDPGARFLSEIANNWVSEASATREIALPGPGGCADARPATLGPGVDRDTGFRMLTLLEDIAAGKRAVSFDCQVVRGPVSCGSAQDIRTQLLTPDRRIIDMHDGRVSFSYGNAPSWAFLSLQLDPDQPDRATVKLQRPGGGGSCQSEGIVCAKLISPQIVAQNDMRAVRILSTPKDSNPQRQYDLGFLYLRGQGVPQDSAKGVGLYRQAAEAGYSPAMLGLAQLFEGMNGVARDKAESDNWYRRWARADDKLYTPEYRARVLAERNIRL